MAEEKTNAMRFLDKSKLQYSVHTYDAADGQIDGAAVAKKVNMPPEKVFKTLVTKGSKSFFVFAIPVDKELNLKACAKAVGEKSRELIKTDDLLKITGYIRGGCSPIGMKKQFTTVFDNSILNLETVVFSGGKIGTQIEISPSLLKKALPYLTDDITAK